MRSRESFTLEPSRKEQEIISEIKENPKGYLENQLRLKMEEHFEEMSAGDLAKYGERGSKERMNMIGNFVNIYDYAVIRAEKVINEKLHESFYSASQKTELIGGVLEKVIKNIIEREKLREDKRREDEARSFRGKSKYPPETLHYGD